MSGKLSPTFLGGPHCEPYVRQLCYAGISRINAEFGVDCSDVDIEFVFFDDSISVCELTERLFDIAIFVLSFTSFKLLVGIAPTIDETGIPFFSQVPSC